MAIKEYMFGITRFLDGDSALKYLTLNATGLESWYTIRNILWEHFIGHPVHPVLFVFD